MLPTSTKRTQKWNKKRRKNSNGNKTKAKNKHKTKKQKTKNKTNQAFRTKTTIVNCPVYLKNDYNRDNMRFHI